MRKNEYSYVENLVKTFFEGDEYAKDEALFEIIECFKPLIVKLMFRYFSVYDEDIMQSAIVELIERTVSYDYLHYNRFAGYIKRFMELYFKRMYFNNINSCEIICDDMYMSEMSCNDVYSVEVDSMMSMLSDSQRYIIKNNVLENKKLQEVAIDMKISYIYAKKIKKSALDVMRKNI